MVAATPLRLDFPATDLIALTRASKDANQTRRLLALASINDGISAGLPVGLAASRRRSFVTGWPTDRHRDRTVVACFEATKGPRHDHAAVPAGEVAGTQFVRERRAVPA